MLELYKFGELISNPKLAMLLTISPGTNDWVFPKQTYLCCIIADELAFEVFIHYSENIHDIIRESHVTTVC